MALGATWYTLADAESKYGLKESDVLKWIEEGLVRSETSDDNVLRVNIDDLKLKVKEISGL